MRRTLAWVVLTTCCWSALAETAKEEGSDRIEEVEVRSTADEVVASSVTTFQADDFEGRAVDVAEWLRRVPGARIRSFGGVGRFATVTLRGTSAEQTAIFVDGVPQNRALGGPVDLSEFALGGIESISVHRGLAPASSGLAGLGGLVDIRTAAQEAKARVGTQFGSFGTQHHSLLWVEPTTGPTLQLFADRFTSDGDFEYLDTRSTPFDPDDDLVRRRTNNDVSRSSVRLRASWLEYANAIHFSVHARDQEQGIAGPDSLPLTRTRLDENEVTAQFGWKRSSGRSQWELLTDAFTREDVLLDPAGEIFGVRDQTTRMQGGGLVASHRWASGRHATTARVEVRSESASVRDRALAIVDRGGASRMFAALTAEDRLAVGRWIVAPALQWEWRDDDFRAGNSGTLPPPAPDVQQSALTGKLGAFRPLSKSWGFHASAGRYWRHASLLELFGDRGAVRGNPNLRPENGLQWEVGISRTRLGDQPWSWSGEIAATWTDADDLVQLVANTGAVVVAQNVNSARIAGIEAAFEIQLPSSFALHASGRLEDNEQTSGGITDDNPLVGRPTRQGFVSLSYEPRSWRAGVELTYVGSNATSLFQSAELPSRTLYDAFVSRPLVKSVRHRLDLDVEIRNVFDHATLDVARFPLPGRSFSVGLRWSPVR